MTPLSPVAALGWLLAGALVLLVLRLREGRAALAGLFGVALASGATLYVQDVVSLPEILGAGLIGLSLGYLLLRERHRPAAARLLLPLVPALAGMTALLAATIALLNPNGFGLLDEGLRIGSGARAILSAALLCGGASIAAALLGSGRWRALLPLLSGGASVALGLLFAQAPLVALGALVAGAALRLGVSRPQDACPPADLP